MTMDDLINSLDFGTVGKEIYALIERLFPICRSITGDGPARDSTDSSKAHPAKNA